MRAWGSTRHGTSGSFRLLDVLRFKCFLVQIPSCCGAGDRLWRTPRTIFASSFNFKTRRQKHIIGGLVTCTEDECKPCVSCVSAAQKERPSHRKTPQYMTRCLSMFRGHFTLNPKPEVGELAELSVRHQSSSSSSLLRLRLELSDTQIYEL